MDTGLVSLYELSSDVPSDISDLISQRSDEIINGDFDPGFMIKLQQKDLRLVIQSAQELNVSIPGTSLVSQLFASLLAQGLGDEGTQALVKAHEQLSNKQARI